VVFFRMIITENELFDTIHAWGNGIINISNAYEEKGIQQAISVANSMLDDIYGFEFGPILFKPTLSGGSQTFRQTKAGALSYFVGHNANFPNDAGFAIKNWCEVKYETSAIILENNIAMWMGWKFFTNKDGDQIKVDKSIGFKKTSHNALKIILHHSSLPYQP